MNCSCPRCSERARFHYGGESVLLVVIGLVFLLMMVIL